MCLWHQIRCPSGRVVSKLTPVTNVGSKLMCHMLGTCPDMTLAVEKDVKQQLVLSCLTPKFPIVIPELKRLNKHSKIIFVNILVG